MSKNVLQRLKTHNKGQVRSTKSYVLWKVVHTETHATQVDARKREKYLKSAAGRRWRKNIWGCTSPTDRSGGAQLATRPNVAFGTVEERSLKSCENVFCLYLV